MVWITAEELDTFAHSFCMPVTLIINFSLFQYLVTTYYKRRRELRGALLLLCAFGGFVTLIPFAYPDDTAVGHLNDISETCSTLTFLIQITIIGRDINKKVKIPALKYMTYASELLILFSLCVVAQNVFEVCFPTVNVEALDGLDNIMEDLGLWFIFIFRFVVLIMAKGYRFVLENKKLEVVLYLLFVTHEYPFKILADNSNVPWEDVQALWNRLTIALYVGVTIQEKIRSNSSKLGGTKMTTNASMSGPQELAVVPATHHMRSALQKMSFRTQVRPASSATKAVPVAQQKKR